MRKIISILFFILPYFLVAQNGSTSIAGARSAAMGNASVAYSSIESIYSNQAGLAELEGLAINNTAQNRFLVSELNSFYVAAAYPTNSGVFVTQYTVLGFEAYNEQKIGLAIRANYLKVLLLEFNSII